jgi:hypothetical protein
MYVYVRHGFGRFYSRIKINKVLDIADTASRKRSGGFFISRIAYQMSGKRLPG